MVLTEYYEKYLRGRDAEALEKRIKSLKGKIAQLKRKMESPDYISSSPEKANDEKNLALLRLYLKRTKEALCDFGVEYQPTPSELRAEEFNNNLCNIERFTLHIGGFIDGWSTYTVYLDDHFHLWIDNIEVLTPTNLEIPEDYPMTKASFLKELSGLNIGEWRKFYTLSRFGTRVLDGVQWDFQIEYKNGRKPITICGDNSYPYNFGKLKELFGVFADDEE